MFKYEWTTRSSTVYVILGAHLLYDGVHHTLLGRDFSMLDISTLGRVPVPKKRLALQTSGREPSEDVCIVRYWHLLGRRAIELGKLAQWGGGDMHRRGRRLRRHLYAHERTEFAYKQEVYTSCLTYHTHDTCKYVFFFQVPWVSCCFYVCIYPS